MSNEFPQGIIAKRNDNAPQWALCKLSFKVEEFIQTLQQNNKNGWCNLEVNISQAGKPYVKFDTWEPQGQNPAMTGYAQGEVRQTMAPQAPPPPPFNPQHNDAIPGLEPGSAELGSVPF
jgi:hypothetical protein